MNWDSYFHSVCHTVSTKSPCLSRKIGAVLVRDKSIISTGYNGPPRGIPHCGHDRLMKDQMLSDKFDAAIPEHVTLSPNVVATTCPRRILGIRSGTFMEYCPAQHAEENAVSNAARNGVSVLGTTLYLNCIIPCSKCFGTLINAGIAHIVCEKLEFYDKATMFLAQNSNITIREFER